MGLPEQWAAQIWGTSKTSHKVLDGDLTIEVAIKIREALDEAAKVARRWPNIPQYESEQIAAAIERLKEA